jgi:phosphoribosylformylglycinamidine cyclo-ligase
MDYREAGVDVEEGYRAVGKYRELAAGTMNRAVLGGIGSFGGIYALGELLGAGMEDPVLVSGTDGVGTKLDVAFRMRKYDTVGIDCVAMCVNDILCHGARPLFFLDYLACGKLDADIAGELVKGVARGCRETGAVLLGGETAEMPGFYEPGKYDIAGFAVGIADRKRLIDGALIREGDALLGLASSGPHSNGFSLIRRAVPDLEEDFGGMPVGLALLEPTRLYVRPLLGLLDLLDVRGMAHITGGGFYENVPRMFPAKSPLGAVIRNPLGGGRGWTIPPIFARIALGIAAKEPSSGLPAARVPSIEAGMDLLQRDGALWKSMFNTFNMGIGLVLALAPEDAPRAIDYLDERGCPAWEIGRVEARRGDAGGVRFE